MKIYLFILAFFLISADNPDPLRFKKEIDSFKEQDLENPPPEDIILFIGSSSIRMWSSMKKDFDGYNVLNRGFGGSQFSDAIYYFDDIVAPYKIHKIIIYEGDNDIAFKKTPMMVYEDFKKFFKMTKNVFPDIEMAFIAAKPSPSRWHLQNNYDNFNGKMKSFCEKNENLTYIDIVNPMLDNRGLPNPELYLSDSLHMTPKGYAIWTKQVKGFIDK